MQVEQEAASQYDLWNSGYLPNRDVKSAALDIFGDLYEPLANVSSTTRFSPNFYKHPIVGHDHLPTAWKEDICYSKLPLSSQPKLLVGNPNRSFLWGCPKYQYKGTTQKGHPRFRFYDSLGDFYKHLA